MTVGIEMKLIGHIQNFGQNGISARFAYYT